MTDCSQTLATIERGIPLPNPQRHRFKVPFREMAIGDSVFVKDDQIATVAANASNHSSRHPGFRFTHRKVPGGYRIWRIPAPKRVAIDRGIPIPSKINRGGRKR